MKNKTAPPKFSSGLVPPLNYPEVPKDIPSAIRLWHDVFWEARGQEDLVASNRGFRSSRHFNPEYFLPSWGSIVLEDDGFQNDALGWALGALRIEREMVTGQFPNDGDMIEQSQSAYFLERLQTWAQARLAYHRTALRLTFYAADSLADHEPLASSTNRLRARFADWRDVRFAQQQRMFASDPKVKRELEGFVPGEHFSFEDVRHAEFKRWLDNEGEASGCIGTEWVEWLPWLHLISPISSKWDLRGVAWAICKSFGGQDYLRDVKKWWAKPPSPLTYATPTKEDGFVEAVVKGTIPIELHDWRAEWLAKRLTRMVEAKTPAKRGKPPRTARFVDTLRKRLESADVCYRKGTGCRKAIIDEAPESIRESLVRTPQTMDSEETERTGTSSGADWDADDPEGWLLANRLSP
jgi:hypothetical protein